MAIALPLIAQLFEPVQAAVEWLSGGSLPPSQQPVTGAVVGRDGGPQAANDASAHRPRPLRVVRVIDGRSRAAAGRMVISGRLDDVCAELDRLAAQESRRS